MEAQALGRGTLHLTLEFGDSNLLFLILHLLLPEFSLCVCVCTRVRARACVQCSRESKSIWVWYLLVGGVVSKALEGHGSSWRHWLKLSSKVTLLLEMFQLSIWTNVGSETLGTNGITTHEPWVKGKDSDVCNSQAHITQWRTSRRHQGGEGRIVCKNEGLFSL